MKIFTDIFTSITHTQARFCKFPQPVEFVLLLLTAIHIDSTIVVVTVSPLPSSESDFFIFSDPTYIPCCSPLEASEQYDMEIREVLNKADKESTILVKVSKRRARGGDGGRQEGGREMRVRRIFVFLT